MFRESVIAETTSAFEDDRKRLAFVHRMVDRQLILYFEREFSIA
jgi:hypothetical protein